MAIPAVFSRNPDEWRALHDKHFMVVGNGSIGGALALMAARSGVGQISLFDNSAVKEENLGRTFYGLATVGKLKVHALKDLILEVNPQAVVSTYSGDFRKLIHEGFVVNRTTSLLIGATDSFACQSLINVLSLETNSPALFVSCWGAATVGEILYVKPGQTPCYNCYADFRHTAEETVDDSQKYFDPDVDSTRTASQPGLWSNVLIICGFAFQVALALVGNGATAFMDDTHNLFIVNAGDFNSNLPFWAVSKGLVRRGCAVCEEAKSTE